MHETEELRIFVCIILYCLLAVVFRQSENFCLDYEKLCEESIYWNAQIQQIRDFASFLFVAFFVYTYLLMVSLSLVTLAPVKKSSLLPFLMKKNVGMAVIWYSSEISSFSSTSTLRNTTFEYSASISYNKNKEDLKTIQRPELST